MFTSGLASSNTIYWATPQKFFNRLDLEFGFDLDVCATPDNAKCKRFYSEQDNGLVQPWRGVCWMNPPYGRVIPKWVKKAYEEAQGGATVVCLLPARTDTGWWHSYAMRANEIRFVRGRLYFNDGCGRAPFPSAVVVFRPECSPLTVGSIAAND